MRYDKAVIAVNHFSSGPLFKIDVLVDWDGSGYCVCDSFPSALTVSVRALPIPLLFIVPLLVYIPLEPFSFQSKLLYLRLRLELFFKDLFLEFFLSLTFRCYEFLFP